MFRQTHLLVAAIGAVFADATILVSGNGNLSPVPAWDLISSSSVNDVAGLSVPGADISSWNHVPVSRCTLMGCLIAAGVYNESDLWFSDNLRQFDGGQFTDPWVYRSELELAPVDDSHFFLQTHGISSRADIYLNGDIIADSQYQAGAYVGRTYDVTHLVKERNALVIQAYPTNYFYDFALGFVDWNPYPPDNGTGVWRDVVVKQTGAASLGPLGVSTSMGQGTSNDSATFTLRTIATNLEDKELDLVIEATVVGPNGVQELTLSRSVTLAPKARKVVELSGSLPEPQIWWPRQWGDQPLYEVSVSGLVASRVSDTVSSSFGFRSVEYELNKFEDGTFVVNGRPFQVIGGGYSADMFLRWDPTRFETYITYMLDMGLNTIRLEGNNEQPELYEICDRLGMMIMAGWECCDKWEAWSYNGDLAVDPVPVWSDDDYETAEASMEHEALMQQPHPSMLGYLVGSDYWPDDRATDLYADALGRASWNLPIIAAASKRGFPERLGPSGMKMEGPYDWVPPNYWTDRQPYNERYGSAFGFGSELGAGVGTPELGSLKKFLTDADMEDLWTQPDKGLYHMSTNVSQFHDRSIYNEALWARYGQPKSLDDYLLKAQIMDYEAVRAELEGYAMNWNSQRPATGMIYWMLVNAWPSLHWNQIDYYLHPGGTFFGSKVGARPEHAAYDYVDGSVYVINRLERAGTRTLDVDVLALDGKGIFSQSTSVETHANTAKRVQSVQIPGNITDVVFLRLTLSDYESVGGVLSRNVYWLSPEIDTLAWPDSTWYHTPVSKYADYTALQQLEKADIAVSAEAATSPPDVEPSRSGANVVVLTVENLSLVPAFFLRFNVVDRRGQDVVPVLWSDNYVTLWPEEKMSVTVEYWASEAVTFDVNGANVAEGSFTV